VNVAGVAVADEVDTSCALALVLVFASAGSGRERAGQMQQWKARRMLV